jgi:SAM-dependent methyltransferase
MDIFWEENHSSQNDYWLSGSNTAEYILNVHKLNNITNKTVLDIGVGLGHLCRYFYSKGNRVIGCDISQIALNRISNFAKTYNTKDLSKIEPVDLAICNLVFQHCNDDEVARIIKDVNLKPGGIFTFQFAFLRDNEPPNENVQNLIKNGTHHFRSLDVIKNMISKTNKHIVDILPQMDYYGSENFSWYIVKLSV